MLSLKNFLIGLLLVVAVGLSGWSVFISNQLKPSSHNNPGLPDAFMSNVIATTLDKQGNPSLKLVTPKMVHYQENDKTDILSPHVTVFRQSPNPWYIDSDFAKVTEGIDQILFWSNVVIYHSADTESPTTTLKTASLTVFPNKKTAETHDAVTIIQPSTIVHAVGMTADLASGNIKLLSQTQGEYVPDAK